MNNFTTIGNMASEFSNESQTQSGPSTFNIGSAPEYVTQVLKPRFGNSEEFLAFERFFYYQTEELNSSKEGNKQLQAVILKLQEEKRSLEFQLLTEKSLRDQVSKNSVMEIEKNNVQQNAQLYTLKYEIETWKRKVDSITTECDLLKEQIKTVELEKIQIVQKCSELKSAMHECQRFRQTCELYARRQKESFGIVQKKLEEAEKARDVLANLIDGNQQQLNKMSLHLSNWNEDSLKLQKRIFELENDLIAAKAELVQNSAKMTRVEMTEHNATRLADKLMQDNEDLHQGLKILTEAIGNQVVNADEQLLQRIEQLSKCFDSTQKRLLLNETDFTPPEEII